VRVAVVGAGISGLAAARAAAGAGHDVLVLEGSHRVGGALLVSDVAGVPVDEGADSFLLRDPAARDLVIALGQGADLVHPAARRARLLLRGRLVALPRTLLGVPLGLGAARPVLGLAGTARAAADLVLPPTPYPDDVAVGAHVRARLGPAVADRLVGPLLGGVYAGDLDQLSLRATLPALADPAGGSLLRLARAVAGARSDAPVFASLPAGLGSLSPLLAAGLEVRTGRRVTALSRTPGGWAVEVGGPHPERLECEAVVLAVPAAPAARLLGRVCPLAASLAGATPYASVAIVTLAFPRATAGALGDPGWSGWLAPPRPGAVVKAVTVSSAKWARVGTARPDLVLVRASVGRFGQERDLQRDDGELTGVVAAEVMTAAGARSAPVASRVSRWGGALPQYLVGHVERVAALRRALPPGLAVCGAAYDGVGIPACVRSGQRGAAAVLAAVPAREAP